MLTFYLVMLHCIPVEFNSMTRSVWSHSVAAYNLKWLRDEFFETKSVNFEVRGIGSSGQQMDMNVVSPMGSDR